MSVSSAIARLRLRLRCERGFTVIEMLVASVIGVVVLLVLLNLLDATQTATSRISARVDGTQRGRTAMEQVTQRLRSQTCVGALTPIVIGDTTSPTDANSVTFYSDLGNSTDFVPEKRRIYVSGTDLRERVTPGTGNPPNTTFTATPKDRIIMQGIKPVTQGTTTLPYFRYYAFDDATPPQPTILLTTPLVPADSSRIVQVTIAFRASSGKEDRVDTNFVNAVYSRAGNPGAAKQADRGPQCT
jgi:prepilin-type N-terminal cleavage/methylation domain-containing protein